MKKINYKSRSFILPVLLLCVVLIASCYFIFMKSKSGNQDLPAEFNATVTAQSADKLTVLSDTNAASLISPETEYVVHVSQRTFICDEDGNTVSCDDIRNGSEIKIYFDGKITKNLPPEIITCNKIVLNK